MSNAMTAHQVSDLNDKFSLIFRALINKTAEINNQISQNIRGKCSILGIVRSINLWSVSRLICWKCWKTDAYQVRQANEYDLRTFSSLNPTQSEYRRLSSNEITASTPGQTNLYKESAKSAFHYQVLNSKGETM